MNENLPVMMNQVNQSEIFNYQNLGNIIVARTETGEPLFSCVSNVIRVKNNRNIMNILTVYEYLTSGGMKQNTFVDQGNLLR